MVARYRAVPWYIYYCCTVRPVQQGKSSAAERERSRTVTLPCIILEEHMLYIRCAHAAATLHKGPARLYSRS